MRNICFITTTRAEYSLLKPLINITNELKMLTLIVTGTHLSKKFGYTVDEIKNDFKIDHCIDIFKNDTFFDMNKVISNIFDNFYNELKRINNKNKIDLLILLGDRFEVFAIAQTAFLLNIKICHIAGGDETEGALDNEFRDCISRLSAYHLPFSKYSKDKLLKMNYSEKSIILLGNPGLEIFNNSSICNKDEIIIRYLKNVKFKNYIFSVFHPETKNNNSEYIKKYFNSIISFSKKYDLGIILIKSNCDPGYNKILDCISNQKILLIDNLERNEYFNLAGNSEFYIGNSSSGIYELPYLKIPIINVGNRQLGRKLSSNIISSDYDELNSKMEYVYKNKKNITNNIIFKYDILESTKIFEKFILDLQE